MVLTGIIMYVFISYHFGAVLYNVSVWIVVLRFRVVHDARGRGLDRGIVQRGGGEVVLHTARGATAEKLHL